MSLIVQVAGGGGAPPSQPPKGGSMTASSHIPSLSASSRPPPAHVTQLTSSPQLGQAPHVVQHHPQPAPHPTVREAHSLSPSYPRPHPLSPHRPHNLAHSRTRAAPSGRMMVNAPMNHLPTPPMPHLPNSPLPLLTPSPAHQLLPTSVNSPSLIPQNIPSGFMPRLPLNVPSPRVGPPSHSRTAPSPRSPQLAMGHQVPSDNNIFPPHAFRKLTRPVSHQPDDDIEVGDTPPHARRALMSPKQTRRNYFNNLALQDHNYCAAPPPSPPRSPSPPPSPYSTTVTQSLGVATAVNEQNNVDDVHSNLNLPSFNSNASTSAPCVGGYPSPHYTGPPLPTAPHATSPLHRLKQTIEEAGVGPMTPLGEAVRDSDSKDRSASDIMEDGGEETETAPEADDDNQDDSITRCICDYLHDDGYMICCDKCSVWQHVVCMGLDRNNIPEEYLCEKCHPRFVDRKRAKALQRAREKEIYARTRLNNDSSDDDKMRKTSLGSVDGLSSKHRKPFSAMSRKLQGKKTLEKKLLENRKVLKKNYKKRGVIKNESNKPTDSSPKQDSLPKKLSPRKNIRRKSLSDSDAESEEEKSDSNNLRSWIDNYEEAVTNHYSPELRARLQGAKLPSNYFKPKDVNGIRCNVSLRGNGLKVLTANNFIPQHTPIIECRGKYMLGSGVAGLKHGRNVPFVLFHKLSPDIEVVVDGKTYGNDSRFCRRADSRSGESNAVIKHHLEKGSLHLYIVASKNIDKNQEILLPALELKNGFVDSEMTIQEEIREMRKVTDRKLVNGTVDGRRRGVSSSSVKRRIKRENVKKKEMVGSSSDEDDDLRAVREQRIKEERERLAAQREERAREAEREREREREIKEERPPSPRKTRFGGERGVAAVIDTDAISDKESVDQILEEVVTVKKEQVSNEERDAIEVKIENPTEISIKEEKIVKEADREEIKVENSVKDEKPLTIFIPKEEGKDSNESPISPQPSMSSPAGLQKSPGKANLGLPDQSGLIVGVNTINYDVSIRNKPKTREEKKMEQILKAIQAMERAEARKRNEGGDSSSDKPEKKRRRSNSVKTGGNSGTVDSALDQSSADEGCNNAPGQGRAKGRGRGRRQTGGGLGGRRRSRAKSGDSSAMSEAETTDEVAPSPLNSNSAINCDKPDQFKFPKHKKTAIEAEPDDDVSRQYLRGSRSPPGIANHLLRSAKTDKGTQPQDKKSDEKTLTSDKVIGCSAKKRWLRAAMSEDISEEIHVSGTTVSEDPAGSGSPAQASPEPDYTPLKKRRLATYNESEEQQKGDLGETSSSNTFNSLDISPPVNDKIKALPNGLKKRLISNLVLEAVLDKAMEDYGGDKQTNLVEPPSDLQSDNAQGNKEDADVEVEKDDAIPPLSKSKEVDINAASAKPKSFKDRKKEAILIAETVLQQGDHATEDAKVPTPSNETDNASLCAELKISDKHVSVENVESCSIDVASEQINAGNEEPSCLTPEKDVNEPESVPDPKSEKEMALSSMSSGSIVINKENCDEKVPEDEDSVPAEEEEFCSTPLLDEEMTDISKSPTESKPIGSSPAPPMKVSPTQLLEPVSPLDTSTISSCPTPGTPVFDEPDVVGGVSEGTNSSTTLPSSVGCPPVPMQHKVFKSFFSTDLSVEDIDRQLEARRELLVREAREETAREERSTNHGLANTTAVNNTSLRQDGCSNSPSSEDSRPGSAGSETIQQQVGQVKKRVSLADYKKRKQQVGGRDGRASESSTPTFNQSNSLSNSVNNIPLATPSLPLPSLPDLPGLESFSGRSSSSLTRDDRASRVNSERDRKPDKGKSRIESLNTRHNTPSPVVSLPPPRPQPSGHPPQLPTIIQPLPVVPTPDHPREGLTERLIKEFGLHFDESDGEGSGGENDRRQNDERIRDLRDHGDRRDRETPSEERERLERYREKVGEVKNYPEKSRDGYSEKSREIYGVKCRESYSDKSRDSGYSDKSRDSYSEKTVYRDSREGYRDSKSRDSYGDKCRDTDIRGSKRGLSNHGGSRRAPHPSSPTSAPGRGMPNQGGARRPPHHPSSPSRRNSQDSSYSHPSSYYKNESSRRNNYSRNFYT